MLFGPDYVRIIPNHRLGAEYEMYYALERHSGLFDLVEIEASTLALFTRGGDPSSHLVITLLSIHESGCNDDDEEYVRDRSDWRPEFH